ncbi:phosphopantetheine-binding protein [Micromonospora sp. WMMD987]|uniref:acyl carrier protein n=1 Tax=Micromonospora TaxID=1873 RepID=UPI002499F8E3|nr:phosphopantetheine-binding protein [Micromonospora sp. WMMD987]WFE95312.1 phosphopantetheine-binding protein [Micromonospora sp. WMMD987]
MPSDTVSLLRDIWSGLLATPIGPDDDFFDNGGYSLLLIEMVIQAAEAGLTIEPEQVFDHPTPAALAAVLEDTPETVR